VTSMTIVTTFEPYLFQAKSFLCSRFGFKLVTTTSQHHFCYY